MIIYQTKAGKKPLDEWLDELDKKDQSVIIRRLDYIEEMGNLGKHKQLKGYKDLWELVFDYGPGYRIYFGKAGSTIVILLLGGRKGSQERDIAKANKYWQLYKEESND